jgi:DNA anti-recombination protein RmuC
MNEEPNSTDPAPQPSVEERLERIELVLAEILAGQKRMFSEFNSLKSGQQALSQEVKDRYVDLRERSDLNNDKLDVVQRELRQLIKDMRNPIWSS